MEGTVFFLPLELSCVVGKSHSMRLKCSVVVECAWPGQQQSRAGQPGQPRARNVRLRSMVPKSSQWGVRRWQRVEDRGKGVGWGEGLGYRAQSLWGFTHL